MRLNVGAYVRAVGGSTTEALPSYEKVPDLQSLRGDPFLFGPGA